MFPFAAISSSQISFYVDVYVDAAQSYWGRIIKSNNPKFVPGIFPKNR